MKTRKQHVLIMLAMFLMFLFTLPVHADNKDVKDTAGVLDNQVQNYIKRVNDDQLEKIKGHPQIAVYIRMLL